MTYSKKFQEVLDKCESMQVAGNPISEIQEFFFHTVKGLGAYERMNNMYRVRPKRPVPGEPSRFQFFRMNKMQEEYWKNQTNRDLILKMRQGGVTTFSCLYALDMCLWETGVHTAIMAHVRDQVKKFFEISKHAFSVFQKDWGTLYPVSSKIDNVNELHIAETGSKLLVCTDTKGLTLDFLHISEACFVDDMRMTESLESVPLTGKVIMESTPDKASGLYYDLWQLHLRKDNPTFTGHFFPWWFHYPEAEDLDLITLDKTFQLTDEETVLAKSNELTDKHIAWRRIKIGSCGGDVAEFRRLYPEDSLTCFLSGANCVFPAGVLAALWKNEKKPSYVGDLTLEGKI